MATAWASVVDYVADLRRFISDGPEDKSVKDKHVVGDADGTNTLFSTFEDRIVEGSLRVMVNGTDVPEVDIVVDDWVLGRFHFTTAPAARSDIRARYFYQDFLDRELIEAAEIAAGEIAETNDIAVVGPGLRLTALKYGAHFAYNKLAMMYARRMSDRFMLQERGVNDAEVLGRTNMFRDVARDMLTQALQSREDFYKGHGRRNTPAFAVVRPSFGQIGPRR